MILSYHAASFLLYSDDNSISPITFRQSILTCGSAFVSPFGRRFRSFNASIQSKHFKSALITAAWNADDWAFEACMPRQHRAKGVQGVAQ